MIALIAGSGGLPGVLSKALAGQGRAHCLCHLDGQEIPLNNADHILSFRVETLVPFFEHLTALGVTEVCFAGAVHRPHLDPEAFDAKTRALAPRFIAAMQDGDDATLRAVIALFEEAGFRVKGAADIVPDLLPPTGILSAAAPDDSARHDAVRAAFVAAALSRADVGQGCVVAQGQVLATEALGGTDWMLASLRALPIPARPDPARGRGLFFKAPKAGQDLRIDMPLIGPATVAAVADAGLGGLVVEAGGVMVLELQLVIAAANAAGVFLWVREAE